MQKFFALIFLFFFLLDRGNLFAQETAIQEPELLSENVDSLIQDSLRKAYILNHHPLTEREWSSYTLKEDKGFYGKFVGYYLYTSPYFKLRLAADVTPHSYRMRLSREWVFYSFAFLFLYLGCINTYFRGYLQKLFRSYFSDGSVFKQTREQMSQWSLASFLCNVFFLFTASLFIYLGMDPDHQQGNNRWDLLAVIFGFLSLVYLFKAIFLHFIGWVFNMREAFDHYGFIVFVSNKVAGLLLLFSTFFMAFLAQEISSDIFVTTLYVLGFMLLFRAVKAYTVFSRGVQTGVFGFAMAFVSLEMIPTAVLIKWGSTEMGILLSNFL